MRITEATVSSWERFYSSGVTPWRSAGLSSISSELVKRFASGGRVLEVGCGLGDDALGFRALGFQYVGVDSSKEAIAKARRGKADEGVEFLVGDLFVCPSELGFEVVYDKGVFHGLGGLERRNLYLRRVAELLAPRGVWLTVCGSPDNRCTEMSHGAIYLRDLVGPAEVYFEVLEIRKSTYGLLEASNEFEAWHAAFRRR